MGEFTAAHDGRVTIELDNTERQLADSYTLSSKTVTIEVASYAPHRRPEGEAAEPEPEPEPETPMRRTASRSSRSSHRQSLAPVASVLERLMSMLQEWVADGVDLEVQAEQCKCRSNPLLLVMSRPCF